MQRAYKVVDVFGARPLLGNPVAVVVDAEGLDPAEMQRIAQWTNLSETTFLLPPTTPEADYRLRIYTPRGELPFAGHPTLGSAHAAIESGRVKAREGRLVQECAVGLVEVAVGEGRMTLTLPAAKLTALPREAGDELEAILGGALDRSVPPLQIDVGPIWVVARVASAEGLLALTPDFTRLAAFEKRLEITGITLFAPREGDASIEVRSFAPSSGVDEDPVCGSGNGSVAVFRRETGALVAGGSYVAAQGRQVGSDGRIAVALGEDGRIRIGGATVTCVDGTLTTWRG